MTKLFSRKIILTIITFFITLVILGFVIFIRNDHVRGVKQYKTIHLGMDAVEKPSSKTIWAPPDDYIPKDTKFVVYALNDESMCMGRECGMGGYFVECLGGWITGYGTDSGDVLDYGMAEAGINIFKEKFVTVADSSGKVVGIYPGAGIRNVPYIMRNHHDLVSDDVFERCYNELPTRWK